jgi:hypothetical protein
VNQSYQLSVESAESQRSLVSWLEGSPDWIIQKAAKPPRSGEMGTGELITVLISSGTLSALVRSLQLWIKYRQPKLYVRVTDPDGKEVVVDATNAGDVDTVLKALGEK